jgi:Tyrosine phosphatase family
MDTDGPCGPGEVPVPPDPPPVTHALEDLPEPARARMTGIIGAVPRARRRTRILDDLEDAVARAYGDLERVPLLGFLSDYPVPSYTYRISAVMARGERPGPQKLIDLCRRQGFRATVNLCAEMTSGDALLIGKAGLAGELRTYHIPIVDMAPPKLAQVLELLDLLTGPRAPLTYVHCEAGKGRTGVMTACYRMAVMGWTAVDALTEARNFGCVIPGQLAFIQMFGDMLAEGDKARAAGQLPAGYELGRYPLQPPGSVRASPRELATLVAAVARAERGQPE